MKTGASASSRHLESRDENDFDTYSLCMSQAIEMQRSDQSSKDVRELIENSRNTIRMQKKVIAGE